MCKKLFSLLFLLNSFSLNATTPARILTPNALCALLASRLPGGMLHIPFAKRTLTPQEYMQRAEAINDGIPTDLLFHSPAESVLKRIMSEAFTKNEYQAVLHLFNSTEIALCALEKAAPESLPACAYTKTTDSLRSVLQKKHTLFRKLLKTIKANREGEPGRDCV